MNLKITDKDGKMPVAEIRPLFEKMVKATPSLKSNTPLGTIEINSRFDHYMDPDTDTLWIGFALGMRMAERIKNSC